MSRTHARAPATHVHDSVPIDRNLICPTAWTFSVTKAYSATVRAGFVIGDSALDPTGIVSEIAGSTMNMAGGLYSEWSWFGQMQIYNMIMEKPLEDKTSWVSAYSELMKEKWDHMIDAFDSCPYIEITNDYAGAYVWFKKIGTTMGLETSFMSAFFSDTMGVSTTTYYWGFRGADPADFYGSAYTEYDFVRLQLYRDLSVYEEVGRRAKIVCSGGAVDGFLSADEYVAAAGSSRRRLSEDPKPLSYQVHLPACDSRNPRARAHSRNTHV